MVFKVGEVTPYDSFITIGDDYVLRGSMAYKVVLEYVRELTVSEEATLKEAYTQSLGMSINDLTVTYANYGYRILMVDFVCGQTSGMTVGDAKYSFINTPVVNVEIARFWKFAEIVPYTGNGDGDGDGDVEEEKEGLSGAVIAVLAAVGLVGVVGLYYWFKRRRKK